MDYIHEYGLGAVLAARLFISLLIAGATTAVFHFLMNLLVMPWTRLKGSKKAIDEGRSVQARLVKIISPRGENQFEQGNFTTGIYKYEYKGKSYQYEGRYTHNPPDTETLIFRRYPATARRPLEYGRLESEWKLILPILTIIYFIGTFFFF